MKLHKLILFSFTLVATNHLSFTMSQEVASKKFVYENLDSIEKYQIFTRGSIDGNTIFDIIFPLAEQKMSKEEIYKKLLSTSKTFSYQNKQETIEKQQLALIANTTGFIPALQNELTMFLILMPGILGSQSDQIAKPNEAEEIKEWSAIPPRKLAISDSNIKWAEQELILEIDFYITKFAKVHDLKLKPSSHAFDLWLQGLDDWWKKEKFEKWITMFVNITTKDRKALPILKFNPKSLMFFLSSYIPKKLIIQNSKVANINWDFLKKHFPGFDMYENRGLFNFAGDVTRLHNMSFLVRMINENLAKIRKNNPKLGQIAPEKTLTQGKNKKSFLILC